MKKFTAIIITLVMLLVMLSACAQDPAPDTDTDNGQGLTATPIPPPDDEDADDTDDVDDAPVVDVEYTEDEEAEVGGGLFPLVPEPVYYDVMGVFFGHSAPLTEHIMLNDLMELTNVFFNWELTHVADQHEVLALTLASGVVPDAFFNFEMSTAQQAVFGAQGLLIPLQDLIAEYAPNVSAIYRDFPHIHKNSIAPDGNIYSLFQYDPAYHMRVNQRMFVNMQWMEDFDLEIPQTTDEFADLLRFFRDNDMNGMGSEIVPLAGSTGVDPAIFLLNSFILFQGQRGINIVDGVVTPAWIQEEYREGLRYLKMLWDEGLMDSEIFTLDAAALSALISRPEEMIVGAFGTAMYQGHVYNVGVLGDDAFRAIPPLEGPTGLRQTPQTHDGVLVGRSIQITNQAPDPHLLIQWMDFWYDFDNAFMQMNGIEGVHFNWVDEPGLDGRTPSFQPIPGSREAPIYTFLENQGPMFFTNEMRYRSTEVTGDIHYVLFHDSLLMLPFLPEGQQYMPFTVWAEEDVLREQALIASPLIDYVREARAGFITGSLCIENDWNNYLQTLEDIGLQEWIRLNQIIFDASN